MKVVRQNETKEFKNSDVCIAVEYPVGDKDINGAVIKLSGRYPNRGEVVNEVCKELVFITQGSGKVVVEGKTEQIKDGDLVLINPGEKYYFDGTMEMFVPCTPAWYPEQHKQL